MSLEKLIDGFQGFRTAYFGLSDCYKNLVSAGQSPEALVIACSDSRNDPALLTRSEPGDIFVVRNVAALVPPYHPDNSLHGTSAAIEFAVRGLKVKNIVVLGHALCGGIQALAGPEPGEPSPAASVGPDFEFLSHWIAIGSQARTHVARIMDGQPRPVRLQALEQAAILTSLNNLMTFPWISTAVEAKTLALHGWYFDMVNGALLAYDFAGGSFAPAQVPLAGFGTPDAQVAAGACCPPWSIENLVRSQLSVVPSTDNQKAASK